MILRDDHVCAFHARGHERFLAAIARADDFHIVFWRKQIRDHALEERRHSGQMNPDWLHGRPSDNAICARILAAQKSTGWSRFPRKNGKGPIGPGTMSAVAFKRRAPRSPRTSFHGSTGLGHSVPQGCLIGQVASPGLKLLFLRLGRCC